MAMHEEEEEVCVPIGPCEHTDPYLTLSLQNALSLLSLKHGREPAAITGACPPASRTIIRREKKGGGPTPTTAAAVAAADHPALARVEV
jgi:hypothetical protein